MDEWERKKKGLIVIQNGGEKRNLIKIMIVLLNLVQTVVRLLTTLDGSEFAASLLDFETPTAGIVGYLPSLRRGRRGAISTSASLPHWFGKAAAPGEARFAAVVDRDLMRTMLATHAGLAWHPPRIIDGASSPDAFAIFPRWWNAAGPRQLREAVTPAHHGEWDEWAKVAWGGSESAVAPAAASAVNVTSHRRAHLGATVYRGPRLAAAFDAWAMRVAVPPVVAYRPHLAPLIFDGRFSTLLFAFEHNRAKPTLLDARISAALLAASERCRARDVGSLRVVFVDAERRSGTALALVLGALPSQVAAGSEESIAVVRWSSEHGGFAAPRWLNAAQLGALRVPRDLYRSLDLLSLLASPTARVAAVAPVTARANASAEVLAYGGNNGDNIAPHYVAPPAAKEQSVCDRDRGVGWSWTCHTL